MAMEVRLLPVPCSMRSPAAGRFNAMLKAAIWCLNGLVLIGIGSIGSASCHPSAFICAAAASRSTISAIASLTCGSTVNPGNIATNWLKVSGLKGYSQHFAALLHFAPNTDLHTSRSSKRLNSLRPFCPSSRYGLDFTCSLVANILTTITPVMFAA